MNAEAEGVVLLAGMPQPRAVEGQRVDLFQRPRLELLPVVSPSRTTSRAPRRRTASRRGPGVRASTPQRNVAADQEVEKAGMIAFLEDQFAGAEAHFARHGGSAARGDRARSPR